MKHLHPFGIAPLRQNASKGQALVILLVYMVISLMFLSAAIIISIANSQSSMQEQEGNVALNIAESGLENALLRLLRDPEYSGETLTVDGGTATVTVTGSDVKMIRSDSRIFGFAGTVQATVAMSDGTFTILSWQQL